MRFVTPSAVPALAGRTLRSSSAGLHGQAGFVRFVPGRFVLSLLMCLVFSPLAARADQPTDWFRWRGPEMNGASREKNLPEKWSPKGENLIWRKEGYGTRCTPIAMNGRIYFVCRDKPETTQEGEKTVCLDAKTGDVIWESVHNMFLSDAPAERVGWASVIGDPETGNIYVLGLGCMFQCLNGETGEILWQRAMNEEYGMLSTYGGRTNFPEIFENLVIISGVMTQWGENAIPAHRFIAFDKRTGEPVWFLSTRVRPEDTTYSTPVFTTFNGQAAMVFGGADGALYAVQPRTGKVIWKYEVSPRGFNTTPLVVDNMVYCAHAEKNKADTTILGAAFALDGRLTGNIGEDQLAWKINAKTVSRSSPVMVNGFLYMVDDAGGLFGIDPAKGKIIFEKKIGRAMFGSLLYADGKLYCGEANGIFLVFRPKPDGSLEELSKVRLNNEEILSSPIASGGRIFLTTTEAVYCIGKKDVVPEADPAPPAPAETPKGDSDAIARIQVVPVEALLRPSDKIPYRVLAFNERGQSLGTVEASFSLDGQGSMENNSYSAPTSGHHVAQVTAKVGEVTSVARLRVVPPLPWKFDFEDGKVPPTWIGAAYRHQPKQFEGQNCLVKISTIPKGTRSQLWMGQSDYSDYTVKADLYSTGEAERRADMGLVNQRYTLDLMAKGQLQIRSWTPRLELRFAKTIPYQWEPNQWYTMKFQCEMVDGSAVLRGKVWKRGDAEPAAWDIEAADATPNLSGSPGLFGNSSLAEFYLDNVEVTPNSR